MQRPVDPQSSSGAGQARGHHAADRCRCAEMRWFKRQALAFFGQSGFQLGQWRAAAHGDDQFAGLVTHDAPISTGVEHIARQVIQRELVLDSSQIESVMREALKLLPLGVGNVRLHINPQDFEQVKALRERHEETWRIVEDAALQPGGCRVETEHSRIDATVETRISQIMAKLLDQAHEQVLNPAEPDLSVDLDAPDAP